MPRSERLGPHPGVESFDSGNADLDGWLRRAAVTADRAGTARVYLRTDDEHRLAGYYAIAPHTVRRKDVPSSVGRGSPDPIPGFLLARLALQRLQQGRGAGGELLVAALQTTLEAIRIGGGRVIVVDAIDDAAHGFYEHFGFRPTPSSPGRLIIKASTAAASLGLDWS